MRERKFDEGKWRELLRNWEAGRSGDYELEIFIDSTINEAVEHEHGLSLNAHRENMKRIEDLIQEKNAWHTAEGCPVSGCPAKVLTSSALNAHVLKEIEGFAEIFRTELLVVKRDSIYEPVANMLIRKLDEQLARRKGKEEIK